MSIIEKALEKRKIEIAPASKATTARLEEGLSKKNGTVDRRIVTYHRSDALIGEYFRQIKRLLQSQKETKQASLFVFTSALRGEGTSTVAVNLATVFKNGSACLVDANLAQPSVHRLLGMNQGVGLADVLAGRSDLEEVLQKCPGSDLTVLTAGKDKYLQPEAIASQEMYEVLLKLREEFEYVLIDAPPILVTADSATLCSMVDGVALVIDMQRSRKKPIKRALETLHDSNILGFILCKGGDVTYEYLGLTAKEKKQIVNGHEWDDARR
jgi:capsular exopolysaccharide synthesis family protein